MPSPNETDESSMSAICAAKSIACFLDIIGFQSKCFSLLNGRDHKEPMIETVKISLYWERHIESKYLSRNSFGVTFVILSFE